MDAFLAPSISEESESQEAWDELEKSIVGSLSDDVQIGIKGDKVQMIIFKSFK